MYEDTVGNRPSSSIQLDTQLHPDMAGMDSSVSGFPVEVLHARFQRVAQILVSQVPG